MGLKIEKASTDATVTMTEKSNGVEKSDMLPYVVTPPWEEETAEVERPVEVGYAVSHTMNLGNYESLRVEVRITVPARLSESETTAAYEFAKEWADKRLEDSVKEATSP